MIDGILAVRIGFHLHTFVAGFLISDIVSLLPNRTFSK